MLNKYRERKREWIEEGEWKEGRREGRKKRRKREERRERSSQYVVSLNSPEWTKAGIEIAAV